MADEQREGWKELYRAAMLETDVEKFRGRVGEAQNAITARLELGRRWCEPLWPSVRKGWRTHCKT